MHQYAAAGLSSLKEAALFNVIAIVLALAVLLVYQFPIRDSFGLIVLFESTGLMLIGGALGVAGQGTTRKLTEMLTKKKVADSDVVKGDAKAVLYVITGFLLFGESYLLAVLLA